MNEDRKKPAVAILPLYLGLYDEVVPEKRSGREAFAGKVAQQLSEAGLKVELGHVCCVRDEVEKELKRLLETGPDMLATLHLAYSPSLESAELLAECEIPLVFLDTTEAPSFGEDATQDRMFENHGIHGVQDLASVLRSMDRDYFIVAGHWRDPAWVEDVCTLARAARAAGAVRNGRTVLIGEPFEGMGDFAVQFERLNAELGPVVEQVDVEMLGELVGSVADENVEAEIEKDRTEFDAKGVSDEVLRCTDTIGLALRRLVEERGGGAFTMNFGCFERELGVPTVPFLEASKAMARGLGYAGEGDVLTASFVRGLMAGFGDTTFTEMFCPDWEADAIFMSHMGECNPGMASQKPVLVEKEYNFSDVSNPAVAVFSVRPGYATLVNIAKTSEGGFSVICAPVEVLDRGPVAGFPDVPHFWIRPENGDIGQFLSEYSRYGGTHHLGLVLEDHRAGVEAMARMLELEWYLV
ncbi:MAG: hypothetical protein ACLFWL_15115 [Candidatus Brocadiia bacterium]